MPADRYTVYRRAVMRVAKAKIARDEACEAAFPVGAVVSYLHGSHLRRGVVTRVHSDHLWITTEATGAEVRLCAERVTGVSYAPSLEFDDV